MTHSRPFLRLVTIALGIIVAWSVVALIHTSEFLRLSAITGGNAWWGLVYRYQLTVGLTWAVLTPPIVFVAERLPLRGPEATRNLLFLLIAAVFFAITRAVVGATVHQAAQGITITREFLLLSLGIRFHRNFFLTSVLMTVTQVVVAQRYNAARAAAALALEADVAKAELEKLRARLQPRFILRALEVVGVRINERPRGADVLLVQLGDLLRTMLAARPTGDWTLRAELERIEPYLAFERTRTAGGFTTRIALPEELLDAHVPSLVLHPLVQDALTRQLERDGGRLEIRGMHEDGELRLWIEETPGAAAPDDAILDEVRARLAGTFGTQGAVETYTTERAVITALRMPLQLAGAQK